MLNSNEEEIQNNNLTQDEFSMEIERRTWEDKDEDSYIYHTVKYMEELNLDVNDGKKYISPSLMDKIRNEAMMNRMLKERHTTSSVMDF